MPRHRSHGNHPSGTDEAPDLDEAYWRKAILQRGYFKPEIGFDRYRWALRYGQMARHRHGPDVTFEQIEMELRDLWSRFGGPSQLTWDEARDAIRDSWENTGTLLAEAIASHGGFSSPPTFGAKGGVVPRNIDEPNC